MHKPLLLYIVAAYLCAGRGVVQAQVPTELREKLLAGEVLTSQTHVFAMAKGNQRGTRETSEDFLVTRAIGNIANKLCSFEVTPGRKLETSIHGVTLIESESKDNEITVFIKVPAQKPSCKVVLVETLGPQPTSASALGRLRSKAEETLQNQTSNTRPQDIVIRKYDGEY